MLEMHGQIPDSCSNHIQKFKDSLQSCQHTCKTLNSRNVFRKCVLDVTKHGKELALIEKELTDAQTSLQLAVAGVLMKQNQELKKTIESLKRQSVDLQETVQATGARLEACLSHPSLGVYHGDSEGDTEPLPVTKLDVSMGEEMMTVRWTDNSNKVDEITRYEIRYDDQKGLIVHADPKEYRGKSDNQYSLRLGPPKVISSNVYTVQVRAINSQGPSEWSEHKTVGLKIAFQTSQAKPSLSLASPTKVVVTTNLSNDKDENGSPVQSFIVEYMPIDGIVKCIAYLKLNVVTVLVILLKDK